nr:MAG TPA: hypothetical protein [Caudoviricetes sp.]
MIRIVSLYNAYSFRNLSISSIICYYKMKFINGIIL